MQTKWAFNHLDLTFEVSLMSVWTSSLPPTQVNSDQSFDLFDPQPLEKGNDEIKSDNIVTEPRACQ